MKYVVSVSKTYIHRGNVRHRNKTKRRWHIYYYDEELKFRTEKVNWLQALYYKTQKLHRIKVECPECGRIFRTLSKSFKDEFVCPYCES